MAYHGGSYSSNPYSGGGSSSVTSSTESIAGNIPLNYASNVGVSSVIDYNKRFYYTDGNDFTFEGNKYIGYVNIDKDNNVYKTKYNQLDKLVPIENVYNDNIFAGKYFDTSIFTPLKFDFVLDDILFKPNEIINKNSINYKLDLFYRNFAKIYNYTVLNDPLVPDNFPAYITLSSNEGGPGGSDPEFNVNTSWQIIRSNEQFISAGSIASDFYPPLSVFDAGFGDNDDTKSATIAAARSTKNTDRYTLFFAISSNLYAYQLNDAHTTFSFVASSTNVGTDSNQIKFKRITSLATTPDNLLFVNDLSGNALYKLDVNTIVNEDRTGLRNFEHIDTIGGIGTYNTNLSGNSIVVYGNDSVYVYMRYTNSIRKYTKELKFQIEYFNEKYFKEHAFQNMSFNSFHNELWIVTNDFEVKILDGDNLTVKDKFVYNTNRFAYEIPLVEGFVEEPRKIEFSTNNSNIYYLVTNKNIYKYYINKQNELVNKFTIDLTFDDANLWNTTFIDYSAMGQTTWDQLPNFDRFFFVDNPIVSVPDDIDNNETILAFANTRIFKFVESNDDVSLLTTKGPSFYKRSEILLSNEYFNNITFNLAFYKHINNLNMLVQNLNKKVLAKFATDFYLFFDDFTELTYDDKKIAKIEDPSQFFVGVNETLNGNVLNRVITNLYEYQTKILELIEVTRLGSRIPPLSTVII